MRKVYLVVFFLAGLTVVPMLMPVRNTNAVIDCSPNNITYSGSSWLGGSGVNVCQNTGGSIWNYIDNVNGTSTQTGYKWQCVELVNRLYITKGWITSRWSGNGNTMVNNVPTGLIKEDNGSVSYLNPGDVITLDDGGDGHAAVIESVNLTTNTITIINQNTGNVTSTAYIQSGLFSSGNVFLHMNGWSLYSVQAVIHAPPNTGSGGIGISRLSAVQHGSQTSVFKRDNNGDIWKNTWSTSNGWSGFSNMGGQQMSSDPWVVYYNSRLIVFAVGNDKQMYKNVWGGSSWSGWDVLGTNGNFTSQPTAIKHGTQQSVFVRNHSNNRVYINTWNGSGWSGWGDLAGSAAGRPYATTHGSSQISVFIRATDNTIHKKTWNGSSWGNFSDMGGGINMTKDPVALEHSNGKLYMFTVSDTKKLYRKVWDGSDWSSWMNLSGSVGIDSAPSAISLDGQMHVFARDDNNEVYKKTFSGNTWDVISTLGGDERGDPFASKHNSQIRVFSSNASNSTDRNTWNGTGWSGFWPM